VVLERYLENGGFLHADDNYGMDESFEREMTRVFPAAVGDVPLAHPVYHLVFDFRAAFPRSTSTTASRRDTAS